MANQYLPEKHPRQSSIFAINTPTPTENNCHNSTHVKTVYLPYEHTHVNAVYLLVITPKSTQYIKFFLKNTPIAKQYISLITSISQDTILLYEHTQVNTVCLS